MCCEKRKKAQLSRAKPIPRLDAERVYEADWSCVETEGDDGNWVSIPDFDGSILDKTISYGDVITSQIFLVLSLNGMI